MEESSIEQEQVPIEFDICQSLRELPTDDNVTRDLRQGSDLIECSVDRNFTVGNIIVIKGKIDPKIDFSQGLKTYERNLQNLIYVCKNNGIKVILCTYCFY